MSYGLVVKIKLQMNNDRLINMLNYTTRNTLNVLPEKNILCDFTKAL